MTAISCGGVESSFPHILVAAVFLSWLQGRFGAEGTNRVIELDDYRESRRQSPKKFMWN